MRSEAALLVAALGLAAAPAGAQVDRNLTPFDLRAPPRAVEGATIPIRFVVGPAGAPTSADGAVWLSDGAYRSGARRIGTFGPLALAADTSTRVELEVALPSGERGLRVLAVELDPAGAVDESNENDNWAFAAGETRIDPPAAAPRVAGVRLAPPLRRAPGEPVTVEVEVANDGRVSAEVPLAVVVGRDEVVSSSDRPLGTGRVTVPAGSTRGASLELTVPSDLGAGQWRIGARADPDQLLGPFAPARVGLAEDALVVVRPELDLLTSHLPDGVLLEPYAVQLLARGGDGSYALEVQGDLPDGLALDGATGILGGRPRELGTFPLDLRVRSAGLVDEVEASLSIASSGQALAVESASLPVGYADRPYEAALLARGGAPPYAWALVEGRLPEGVRLVEGTGRLEGRPAAPGRSRFTVQLSDQAGASREAELTLSVSLTPDVFIATERVELAVGEPADVSLEAVGGRPPYRWTAGSVLTDGLTLTEDGRLTGIPTRVGRFPFRAEVADATDAGIFDAAFVDVEITDDGAIAVTSGPMPPRQALTGVRHLLTADGGTPPYRWRVLPGQRLPNGLVLAPGPERNEPEDTAVISGRVTSPGVYAFTVRVEDAYGRAALQPLAQLIEPRAVAGGGGGCRAVASEDGSGAGLLAVVLLGLWLRGPCRRARDRQGLAPWTKSSSSKAHAPRSGASADR